MCERDEKALSFVVLAPSSNFKFLSLWCGFIDKQEVSPLTSGRLSHSSGPLNGGSLTETDSPPVSPSEEFDDVVKVLHFFFYFHLYFQE